MRSLKAIFSEIPGVRQGAPERELFRFPRIDGETTLSGLPRGAIIELSGALGAGKTEILLRFLAVNPEERVAWIEVGNGAAAAYPCAFPQVGVRLDRVLFIISPRARLSDAVDAAFAQGEMLWAAHQTLRSQVFGIIVLSGDVSVSELRSRACHDVVALRRLQIAAEKSACSVILLTEEPAPAFLWPISVQIQVSRDIPSGSPVFRVLKWKGTQSTTTTTSTPNVVSVSSTKPTGFTPGGVLCV